LTFQEEDWVEAIEVDGTVRDGAWVAELTDLMDLSTWSEDARLICRRERPHPGAQLSLFDTSEGFRHTCFITNANALSIDAAALELRQRGHARVEDRVRCWKDCGLQNLPFVSFTQNLAWVATSLIAGALLSWAQMTCLDGELKKAEPKTLRYRCCTSPPSSCAVGTGSSCDWTRPGRGQQRSGEHFSGCGPRSHNNPGPGARPDNGESPEGVTSDKSTKL